MDALIRLDDVTKRYGGAGRAALDGIGLQVAAGEAVAIMGPSGSGKSTLLNLVAGLDRPTRGAVTVGGKRIDRMTESGVARFRRQQIGMIFQFFNLLDDLTVLDNVLLPAQLAGDAQEQTPGHGPASCSPRCGSPSTSTPIRPGCRAVNGSGWRSPGRW